MVRSDSAEGTQSLRSGDYSIAVGVGIVIVAIVLMFRPILGIPRNDDFSYARTAESFARTGHVVYNGWGSPLMLPQALVGGLLVKLFGFSYVTLDCFGVACAGATAAILFALCRLVGLNTKAGLLIVAVLVVNPMFLAMSATFMTDIPSLMLLLCALFTLFNSLQVTSARPDIASTLRIIPSRFWISAALGLIAGTNRQLSWVAYLGAVAPILFALKMNKDRMIVGTGAAVVVAAAVVISDWLARQPMTVPTNVLAGIILLVGYVEAIFAVVYRFFFIFGLFILPIVIGALEARDFRRLWFWGALALAAFPLPFPVSNALGYFRPFYGAAPSGQYFTSSGVRIGYMAGNDPAPQLIPISVVYLWIVLGVLALGISLYLITLWVAGWRTTRRDKSLRIPPTASLSEVQRVFANALLVSTLAEIVVSIPWFAQLHLFDRYFLFYLPGFGIFFMLQRKMRVRSNNFLGRSLLQGCAALLIVMMAIVSFAMTATYLNCGRAQAILYSRLRARGIPVEQIDNGFEFDADAQVKLHGYINSKDMVPLSAYNPNTMARNIPSVTPTLFPVMDGRYIFSYTTRPSLKFPVDETPEDSESYVSYLPPGRLHVFVLRVTQ